MVNLIGTYTLTPLGTTLTRPTEKCLNQLSGQDIDKYADFIITAISTAIDKAIPTSKSGSQPVSEESLTLIKEKRIQYSQYSQAHNSLVKTRINQLQKEFKDNLRIESQASWEKFCNNISLESYHTEPKTVAV